MLKWIRNFITLRQQLVCVDGIYSALCKCNHRSSSVLRSLLGPVLFVCYINDMPESVTSFLFMYVTIAKLEDRYYVKLIVTFTV